MPNMINTTVPMVGQRIILRRFRMEDAAVVQRMCDSDAVWRGTLNLPHPYTLACAQTWIASHDENFRQGRYYDFAIADRETDALYGCIGVSGINANGVGELGYWIGEEYWNRGYATEAAQLLIGVAFREWKLRKMMARHFSSNPASGRVMQKCGMTREGILRQHLCKNGVPKDIVYYGLLREEWNG